MAKWCIDQFAKMISLKAFYDFNKKKGQVQFISAVAYTCIHKD